MAAGDGYEKLYKGVKSQVDKWSDDELEAVRKLAEADTQPTPRSLEIIEAITCLKWSNAVRVRLIKG